MTSTLARSASEGIRHFYSLALILLLTVASTALAADRPLVLLIVGAEGTEEFGKSFRQWSKRWESASKQAQADFTAIGLETPGEKSDRDLLQERLASLTPTSTEPLWLVLIGHGTFDGKTARFNLRGPDFSPAELAAWLKPVERPLVVANCASGSGPFLNELSAPGRIVITATRNGFEYNYARFGDYFSSAISDLQADLDKDEQTSLLEAYLRASAAAEEFYKSEGRLSTEHALLDDNGDKLGTPADWFQGLRAIKSAKDGVSLDGLRAGQMVLLKSRREEQLPAAVRARRDELERELATARQRKTKLSEDEYLKLIEPLLIELAHLYDTAEKSASPPTP
jgi:hypothetical protein